MGCFSSSEGKQQSQSYLPAQADWLTKLLNMYGPQAGQGANVYQGETVAPFTSGQTGAIDQANSMLGLFGNNSVPGYDQMLKTTQDILGGNLGADKITSDQEESMFNTIYRNPSIKNYQEVLAPATREAYAGPGYWSSARAGAEQKTAQDTADTLTQARGQFGQNILQSNQALDEARASRALGALGIAPTISQLPQNIAQGNLAGTQSIFNFASAQQQQDQNNLNAAYQKFLQENRDTDPEVLSVILNLLGINMQTSSGTQSGPGLGYAGLVSLLGNLPSPGAKTPAVP